MLSGHKVPLVLAGQASCYERFEVDSHFVNLAERRCARSLRSVTPRPVDDGELTSPKATIDPSITGFDSVSRRLASRRRRCRS